MDRSRGTLSIVVPALDEEANVAAAVEMLGEAASRWFADHEIIVVNDGSVDGTARVIDELARGDARIRASHHDTPRGLGGAFRSGLRVARMDYVIRANGCNDMTAPSLDTIFREARPNRVVIPFTTNTAERSRSRRTLSWLFTRIMNSAFGHRLRYYNHSVLAPTQLVRAADDGSSSYAFGAAMLVRLLDRGVDFVEVGVEDRFDPLKRTKAFRVANVLGVARDVVRLFVRERVVRRLHGEGVWGASRLAT